VCQINNVFLYVLRVKVHARKPFVHMFSGT